MITVKVPEKIDLFMSCVFAFMVNEKTQKLFAHHLTIEEQYECVGFLGSIINGPLTEEEMNDLGAENLGVLENALKEVR